MVKQINEQEFWKWLEQSEAFGFNSAEIKRRWETALSQKIKDANWQIHKLEEAATKLTHILQDEPFGKVIMLYLQETDEELKSMIDEVKEKRR